MPSGSQATSTAARSQRTGPPPFQYSKAFSPNWYVNTVNWSRTATRRKGIQTASPCQLYPLPRLSSTSSAKESPICISSLMASTSVRIWNTESTSLIPSNIWSRSAMATHRESFAFSSLVDRCLKLKKHFHSPTSLLLLQRTTRRIFGSIVNLEPANYRNFTSAAGYSRTLWK